MAELRVCARAASALAGLFALSLISGSAGTAQAKKEALEKVGVRVGRTPSETAGLVREFMQGR